MHLSIDLSMSLSTSTYIYHGGILGVAWLSVVYYLSICLSILCFCTYSMMHLAPYLYLSLYIHTYICIYTFVIYVGLSWEWHANTLSTYLPIHLACWEFFVGDIPIKAYDVRALAILCCAVLCCAMLSYDPQGCYTVALQ